MHHPEYREYLRRHKRNQNKGAYGKDSEMTKLYKCEWAVSSILNTKDTKFEDIDQAQKFANRVTRSKTWDKVKSNSRKSVLLVKMKDSSGGIAGLAEYGGLIKLKSIGLNKYTVLHELAHQAGHMHHGRSFRQCLLKLVSQFMGRKEADALKAEFKKAKLAFGNPRKPLTEAQWLKARNRMRSIRG